eukprot:gene6811-44015_t
MLMLTWYVAILAWDSAAMLGMHGGHLAALASVDQWPLVILVLD